MLPGYNVWWWSLWRSGQGPLPDALAEVRLLLNVPFLDRDASSDDTIEMVYIRNSRNHLQTELFIYS